MECTGNIKPTFPLAIRSFKYGFAQTPFYYYYTVVNISVVSVVSDAIQHITCYLTQDCHLFWEL